MPLDFYRDTGGPLGRTVTDVAKTFSVLTGVDERDVLTDMITEQNVSVPADYTTFLDSGYLAVRPVLPGLYKCIAAIHSMLTALSTSVPNCAAYVYASCSFPSDSQRLWRGWSVRLLDLPCTMLIQLSAAS